MIGPGPPDRALLGGLLRWSPGWVEPAVGGRSLADSEPRYASLTMAQGKKKAAVLGHEATGNDLPALVDLNRAACPALGEENGV